MEEPVAPGTAPAGVGAEAYRNQSPVLAALRQLPAVDQLLRWPEAEAASAQMGRPLVVRAIRTVLERMRTRLREGGPLPSEEDLRQELVAELARVRRRLLRPVINATGVVLHTNLGRAPLSPEAAQAVWTLSQTYSNLEYDLEGGGRSDRYLYGERLLQELTGAEAAMVVNNNAAAVLLALTALAKGREVILSRGEMIEIGGSFRIPEVMAQSGCLLKEIGTTNRTHLRDYEAAITPDTAAILKVHRSNYKIVGFTAEVTTRELAVLAEARGLWLLEDLGSGVLLDTRPFGLAHEPTVAEVVAAGAHLVTFSGDKLLGGPQAGVIVGRRELVERCKRHPLARALRVDKMTLAALEATLLHYLRGDAAQKIPIWQMMGQPVEGLAARAHSLAERLQQALAGESGRGAVRIEVQPGRSAVGGGSLPGETLPTWLVAVHLAHVGAQRLSGQLRRWERPVIGRIEEGRFLLDLRTVRPEEEGELVAAVAWAVRNLAGEGA